MTTPDRFLFYILIYPQNENKNNSTQLILRRVCCSLKPNTWFIFGVPSHSQVILWRIILCGNLKKNDEIGKCKKKIGRNWDTYPMRSKEKQESKRLWSLPESVSLGTLSFTDAVWTNDNLVYIDMPDKKLCATRHFDWRRKWEKQNRKRVLETLKIW